MTSPRTGRDTTPLVCHAPVNLTVDHLAAPTGVAVPRPVLAWRVPGPAPARAYEIEVRRLDPADAVSVRDLVIFLTVPRCTIARHDANGVHIYACDDIEVPHIALANDHLYPWPVIDDGPEEIFDTLASAARL